jgi:hypothetical protein
MTAPREGWTTNYDDAARLRARGEERPLGGRRKWSTGLSRTGWFVILCGVALTIGIAIALAA